jgi:methyl-accepting chemotaxis protein
MAQANGTDQINGSIQQLSRVMQQNAGVAEKMASTAEEFTHQASLLQNMISFFRIRKNVGAYSMLPR